MRRGVGHYYGINIPAGGMGFIPERLSMMMMMMMNIPMREENIDISACNKTHGTNNIRRCNDIRRPILSVMLF